MKTNPNLPSHSTSPRKAAVHRPRLSSLCLCILTPVSLFLLASCRTVKRDASSDVTVSNVENTSTSTLQHDADSLSHALWQKLVENWTSELGAKMHLSYTSYDTSLSDSTGEHPVQSTCEADVDLTLHQNHSSTNEREELQQQTHHSDKFGKTESHVTNDSTSQEHVRESTDHTTFQKKLLFTILLFIIPLAAGKLLIRKK